MDVGFDGVQAAIIELLLIAVGFAAASQSNHIALGVIGGLGPVDIEALGGG